MREYTIFVGNFGSGKSELAINLALRNVKTGDPTTLVDLDVVNPYFRSAERKEDLEAAGVRLIMPPFALHKIEIMSLTGEVYAIFDQRDGHAIIDAGGDPIGATALGQYKPNFDAVPEGAIRTLMVINPFRPLAATAEKAALLLENIQRTSRQKITGLINNANLAHETGPEELLEGYHAVKALSIATGIPVYATAGIESALAGFEVIVKAQGLDAQYIGHRWPLSITMHRTWERYAKEGL